MEGMQVYSCPKLYINHSKSNTMRIWFNKEVTVTDIKDLGKDTMAEHIGIQWIEIGDNFVKAKMPVDQRTSQPYGLLHGGASCVLAETIGSIGSALVVDHTKFVCVGLEINANHVRSAREGYVTGVGHAATSRIKYSCLGY
jgi:1,4-dihydroxy-2-naphthoyl-CoA hydrolase